MEKIYVDQFGRTHVGEMAEAISQLEDSLDLMDILDDLEAQRDDIQRTAKGGNKMKDLLFKTEDDIYVTFDKEDSKNKRRAKMIKKIVTSRTSTVLTKPENYVWSGAIGLMQGLKYSGNLKTGIKGAVGGLGTILLVDVLANVAVNAEKIKDA